MSTLSVSLLSALPDEYDMANAKLAIEQLDNPNLALTPLCASADGRELWLLADGNRVDDALVVTGISPVKEIQDNGLSRFEIRRPGWRIGNTTDALRKQLAEALHFTEPVISVSGSGQLGKWCFDPVLLADKRDLTFLDKVVRHFKRTFSPFIALFLFILWLPVACLSAIAAIPALLKALFSNDENVSRRPVSVSQLVGLAVLLGAALLAAGGYFEEKLPWLGISLLAVAFTLICGALLLALILAIHPASKARAIAVVTKENVYLLKCIPQFYFRTPLNPQPEIDRQPFTDEKDIGLRLRIFRLFLVVEEALRFDLREALRTETIGFEIACRALLAGGSKQLRQPVARLGKEGSEPQKKIVREIWKEFSTA